jgi:hypothetical protein
MLNVPLDPYVKTKARRTAENALSDTYKAALGRAAELVGGVQQLSARLRVPVADLVGWIQGERQPPMGVFLQVVDLLIEQSKPGFRPLQDYESKPIKPRE